MSAFVGTGVVERVLTPGEALDRFGAASFPPLADHTGTLGESIFVVAHLADGEPEAVGLAHVSPLRPTVEVLSLWVDEKRRRQGLGHDLLRRLEDAAIRAGSATIEGRYRTSWPSTDAVERLLAARGWEPPRALARVYAGNLANARTIGRMPLFQVPDGYEVLRWADLPAREWQALDAALPASVDPAQVERGYETHTAIALRHGEDGLVGWCLTHRTAPDTIQFTALWVHPAHRERGLSLVLAVEVGRRMGPAGFACGQCVVAAENEPMRYFVEDHLVRFGYLSAEAEVRASGRRLA